MSITELNPAPDASMPLERLEARIVELASQIAGATCELLKLVGEFDSLEGWRSWGMSSTAYWLSWKCGVGMTAAREQVRVARVMREFPTLVAEFAAGRLSYSKVRAITRIATADNIETLIDWALHSTGAQLDRIVAGLRRATRTKDVQAQRAQRSLTWHWDDDGRLVGSFRLPPDEGMRLIAAVEAAKTRLPEPVADVEDIESASVPGCGLCAQLAALDVPGADADHLQDHAREICPDASAEEHLRRRRRGPRPTH